MPEQAPQRRLAAILAADVVGYSRKMQADEAGTLAALKSRRAEILQPLVSKHHGRIIKVMGDGVLVEFASAVGAVSCAVALQEAMAVANEGAEESRRVVLRMGINLGDVMVEGGDLYGDGVNIAARLEGIAEPGSICVSAKVREEVAGKVSCQFVDLGEQMLKNIAQPHRVYMVSSAGTMPGQPASTAVQAAGGRQPSIAVLPLTNMSGDPEQQYLSDGITEDLITELSRYHELLVIARNSSFQFRDKSIDMKRVGRELGAEYLVEGSLRKAGNRLRVTVQLIETAAGAHLWAEKYDRDLADVFAIQDEVAQTVAAALVGRVSQSRAESARRKPTAQWAAYDCFLQALDYKNQYKLDAAIALLQRALALDSRYAQAHAQLANCYTEKFYLDAQGSTLTTALSHAEKAISIDPNDTVCHRMMAFVQIALRNFDVAGQHLTKAIALNPDSAVSETTYAFWLWAVGRTSEALDRLDAAAKRDPFKGIFFYQIRGYALFDERRYEEAIDALNQVNPKQSYDRAHLAAAYAYLGRDAEARAEAADLLQAHPEYSISWFARVEERKNLAARERFAAGSRMAGIPE
jgi:TolB-like protein/class 3 adenylate cyclase